MNQQQRQRQRLLRATRVAIELNPFGFWLIPRWHWRRDLTEQAKAEGEAICWVRWSWFQISLSRWR